MIGSDEQRLDRLRSEWRSITRAEPIDLVRFHDVRREAEELVDAGLWVSGPADMLSVLGRHRDELVFSAMLAWLFVPTSRHGLGRSFLLGFLDHLWPAEGLMRNGVVTADREEHGLGLDDTGRLREAWADIVIRCDGMTVIVENKIGAGEQPDQCERQYWGWKGEPGETRWVFLTPTGRRPVTATSEAARAAWRTMSYPALRSILATSIAGGSANSSLGRATAMQFLETLNKTIRG